MSIGTIPPVKHRNKSDHLKCKLLKKIRKHFILYKCLHKTNTPYYIEDKINNDFIYFNDKKSTLKHYHESMMLYLNIHYYKLWNKVQIKTEKQILP